MGDKYIYVYTIMRRGHARRYVVDSLKEVPRGVDQVECYMLDRVYVRNIWS